MLQIKLGFELKGHTHEDIDQMFSRLSVALLKANMRQLSDVVTSIRMGFTPSPHVEVIRNTMDFDALNLTIGKGTISGIMGSHSAAQEEKPHQMKIIMEEGRAVLYMKRLSTEKVWHPLDRGIKLLRHSRWEWPMEINTRHIVPATEELLSQLTRTMGLLDRENTGQDHGSMMVSWKHNLFFMENPVEVRVSRTWQLFLETFTITREMGILATPPSKEVRRLNALRDKGPLPARLDTMLPSIRDGMTGIPEDEVSAARASELERVRKDKQNLTSIEFTVAPNPNTQMGGKRGLKQVHEMAMVVGTLYAIIVEDARGWGIGKCTKLVGVEPDTFEMQWMGARQDKLESGKIVALVQKVNKKNTPWVQEIGYCHLLGVDIKLNSQGKLTPFYVSKVEEGVRLYILREELEAANAKRLKTKSDKKLKA
jgi:hypothetical protein